MKISEIMEQARGFAEDGFLLLRKELQLAREEAGEKIEQAQSGIIMAVAGMLMLFVALLMLVEAVVVWLANFMAPEVAALLTGVVLAVIGAMLALAGRNRLSGKNLKPSRTIRSAHEGVERLKGEFS